MSTICFGVDIGNHDAKTVHTSTPSGFSEHVNKPFSTDEYLFYNGKYYIPESERFPYLKDKTTNEHAFVLTLMALGKEILHRAETSHQKKKEKAEKDPALKDKVIGVQKEIDRYNIINLGVGVPPIHVASLKQATLDYYKNHFSGGVSFVYNGYNFSLKLNECACYAQDLAAVVSYKPKGDSVVNFNSYYAIDIGGQTVDAITFINGRIDLKKCDSKPLGVLAMCESLVRDIEAETGRHLSKDLIESVLRDEPTILPDDIKNLINELARKWLDLILGSLVQFGMEFDSYPVLFIGGGSLLFKRFIDEHHLAKYEFIKSPNANALGYEKMIKISTTTLKE